MTLSVSILGGAGYVGGELLRLLLSHPNVTVKEITSASQTGRFVYVSHPNLRGQTSLKFIHPDQLSECDVLFLAQPHGVASKSIERFANLADRIIDTSADFRLRDPASYEAWYGEAHPAPEWLSRFSYGLPERYRSELVDSTYISGVGCNATVTNLGLLPLAREGVLDNVIVDVKVGSSESGARGTDASHHPERSGSIRSFKPTGHRHQAEIKQVLGTDFDLHFSVTSVEMVRGALATSHCFLKEEMAERDLWKLYRTAYKAEPFIRLVKSRVGIHRYPDPKLLAGTNYCDIGFEVDAGTNRVVVISAIDNLMKGAAGTAVQAMNVMCGFEEVAGLGFSGLHPL
ncbi:MAG: N-acetyl-gamma-glutamyl-phosphate reductase [Chloroflexota bacterium]